MIDLNKLSKVVFAILDDASARCPIQLISARIVEDGSVPGFEECDDADRDTLVRAVVVASADYDIRAGRTGGAGRKELFKGGSSAAEPTGPGAKLAKRLREAHGLDRATALRATNRFLEHLMNTGEMLTDDEIARRFK